MLTYINMHWGNELIWTLFILSIFQHVKWTNTMKNSKKKNNIMANCSWICHHSITLTWNVWWFVNEYITIKPWPFFIYKSLIDANCSVPAVSNISRTHGELSTYKLIKHNWSMILLIWWKWKTEQQQQQQ